jgi:hypothetical protein
MADNQAMASALLPQEVLASSFGAKASTKGEVWRFLTTEAGVYLPSYATVTIWHVSKLFFYNAPIDEGFSVW